MRPETNPRAPLGILRAAFEATGTPAWVMRVIKDQGLDLAEGFRLDLELTGDAYRGVRQATAESLLSGRVDLIDTDWISIGRMRRDGFAVSAFHPYGRIMGGLVMNATRFPDGSREPPPPRFSGGPLRGGCDTHPAGRRASHELHPTAAFRTHLEALAGRTIAVTNRFDKTWILLRAYAMESGFADPERSLRLVEAGSKREVLRLLREGEVDGAILFWHLAASACMDERFLLVFDALNAVEALTGSPLPTTFFVAAEERLGQQPDLFHAFTRAFDRAVEAMHAHEPLWRHGVADAGLNGLAQSLRAAWLRRIGTAWPDRLARRLAHCTEILKTLIDASSMGLDTLPAGTFALEFFSETEVTA